MIELIVLKYNLTKEQNVIKILEICQILNAEFGFDNISKKDTIKNSKLITKEK